MGSKTGLFIFYCCIFGSQSLEIINQWNFVNFDLPPDFNVKNFRPENTVFTGIEVTEDRIFLSMPRLRSGVPATLATIPRNTPKGSSPILQAYPDWSLHRAGSGDFNCSGLITVYRIRVDSCNRLWVLDGGVDSSIDNFTRVCPPKILVFDLRTNRIVRTVIFPTEVYRPTSLFTNIVVDESVQGKCDSAFVYMTDSLFPGIVVYDGAKDTTWRFQDPVMFPNPDYSKFNINGESFSIMDGIIGLAHSPGLATLFFQPLATDKIYSVPTAALRKGPPAEFEELPITLAGKKSSQGLGLALNQNDNTLYFSPISETSIASWNVVTNQQSVIVQDPVNLEFPAELRWKEDNSLWVVSTRFHKFFRRTVTPNEINLRVMQIKPTREVYHNNFNNFYF